MTLLATSKIKRLFARALRDRSGATAVEFGLIALPFLAVLMAIFEVSYVHLENELMAGALTKAARTMITGAAQTGGVKSADDFKTRYLCPANGPRIMPSNIDCTNLSIDVRTVAAFTNATLSNDIYKSSSNEFCPGKAGDIVVMRLAYPLPAIMPLNLFSPSNGTVSDVPNSNGKYHILMATELFKAENFSGTATTPKGC